MVSGAPVHEGAGAATRSGAEAPGRAKVLFVIGTLDVGGAETQLVELASRLDRRSYEPVVCSVKSGGPLQAELEQRGVRVCSLGFSGFRRDNPLVFPRDLLSATLATLRLWRLMRRERPDIVHGILISAYLLATFVGRLAGVRIIVSGRRSLGLFKEHMTFYLRLERLADRMTDLFIANSEAVRQDTLAREPIDAHKILVIYNGLDLTRFKTPAALRRPAGFGADGWPFVIVVSNFIYYKGHEHFLSAWPEVLRHHPRAIAVLVGDGPLKDHLQARADQLGIGDSVLFLGVRSDVPELLAASDVFVHPSSQEGNSNAVLEAMAAGKPIVATAVGGTVEAIRDGETGILVPPNDSRALAGAMLRILGDLPAANVMARRARAAVEQHFEVGAMVAAYERIYGDLLAGRRGDAVRAVKAPAACRD